MPAAFLEKIDRILDSLTSEFTFFDLLLCTKESLSDHENELDKALNLLIEENLGKDNHVSKLQNNNRWNNPNN